MAAQRVAVIGNGGAGKTWLARRLGERLDLPISHLDGLYYDSDWRECDPAAWAERQRQLVAGERWLIDGNYLQTLPLRLARADLVVLLDPPALVCAGGLLERRLRHGGGQHPDIGVYDRLNWGFLRYVLAWRRRQRPRVMVAVRQHAPQAQLVHLRSRRQARRFLEGL